MQHRLTVKMYRLFIVFGISFGLCCTGTALCAEDIIQDQPLVTGLPNFAPLIEKLAPVTVNISSSRTVILRGCHPVFCGLIVNLALPNIR